MFISPRVPSKWVLHGLAGAALLLSACGGGGAASPTAAPAAKPTEAAKPAAAAPSQAPAAAAKPSAVASPAASPAASGAAAPAAAKPATEDMAALYEEAKKEGEFNWYTTTNTNNGQPVVEKFMKRYPGVKVNYNRQNSEKLEEVVNAEAKSGKMNWDSIETNLDLFVRFIDSGYLQQYVPPIAAKYSDGFKDPNGYWVSDRANPQTPSVNTSLVKPEDYPKAWDDLTQPQWKGKMAVEQGNVLLFTATKWKWGDEKALAFWKGIADNQPSFRSGNTDTAQLLAAGEFPLAVNIYTGEPERLRLQGAPTKVVPLDPVFVQVQSIGLGAKAPHPNAAKLFINWLLSDEGQQAYADAGILPSSPEFFKKGTDYLGNTPIAPIPADVSAKSANDLDQWRQVMRIP